MWDCLKRRFFGKVYSVDDYDATFAIVMKTLKLVGLRLSEEKSTCLRIFWNVFYWLQVLSLFSATVLELIKIAETARGGTFDDAVAIFRMMPCIGYMLLASIKSHKILHRRPVYENLMKELQGMWPRGAVSEEEHLIIQPAIKHLHYVIKGYYWTNNALFVMFMFPPCLSVLQRALHYDVPRELPFYFWLPFDHLQPVYYEIILVIQTWEAFSTIYFMLCGDLLFCIFLCHITTQFDLLAYRIRRLFYVPLDGQLAENYPLGKHCKEFESDNQLKIHHFKRADWELFYQNELAEIILRHRALVRLSTDVEDLFSFGLLINFFNSSIIICCCGFCCILVEKWNEMIYKFFLTASLSQTWLLCWYGQRLLESSEGVSTALYDSGWYTVSERIKSAILIMIHRTQKNVHVTTYGFSVISLASYTTIIKTSWSYFTLLLRIYKQ